MCGKSVVTKTSNNFFLLLIWEPLCQQALAYEGPDLKVSCLTGFKWRGCHSAEGAARAPACILVTCFWPLRRSVKYWRNEFKIVTALSVPVSVLGVHLCRL